MLIEDIFMQNKKIILASASPRRAELLTALGIAFSQVPGSFNEPAREDGQKPGDYVMHNARGKAESVARSRQDAIIIGADTVVVYRDRVLGKPADFDDARRCITMLKGRTHAVYTGLCVIDAANGRLQQAYEKTAVRFRDLTEAEIDAYLLRIEPLDKAGAYAIQGLGALVVERIQGCYYNVVGFPVAKLEEMLLNSNVSLFQYMR